MTTPGETSIPGASPRPIHTVEPGPSSCRSNPSADETCVATCELPGTGTPTVNRAHASVLRVVIVIAPEPIGVAPRGAQTAGPPFFVVT